jgi:hypothetical protein
MNPKHYSIRFGEKVRADNTPDDPDFSDGRFKTPIFNGKYPIREDLNHIPASTSLSFQEKMKLLENHLNPTEVTKPVITVGDYYLTYLKHPK